MSKNAYEILGVSPSADMHEIEQQYYALRDRYREEMYQEGAVGKAAAKKLNEIEQAYSDICAGRASVNAPKEKQPNPIVMDSVVNDPYTQVNDEEGAGKVNATHSSSFDEVQSRIDQNDLKGAQSLLDSVGTRDAEWHYYQAMIYYKKKWPKEAVNQMEMACQMEPNNAHYAKVLEKLRQKASEPKSQAGYNEQTQSGYQRSYQERDARAAEDGVCRFCETLICINCLCDCCCRG